jgi:hypothetical protein
MLEEIPVVGKPKRLDFAGQSNSQVRNGVQFTDKVIEPQIILGYE